MPAAPTAITPSGAAAFSNTAAATGTVTLATAHDNTAPAVGTVSLATAHGNTAPTAGTPSGSATLSNTAPDGIGIGSGARATAITRPAANLAALTSTPGTVTGVSLGGTLATRQDRLVLLTAQSTASQNGLYAVNNGGAAVSLSGASYDGSGEYEKTGLTAGRLYYWAPGAFGTSIEGAGGVTLTAAGFIEATSGGSLTFYGAAAEGVDATLKEANLERAAAFDAAAEFLAGTIVQVSLTSPPTWWKLSAAVATLGSSSVTFTQLAPPTAKTLS